MLKSNKLDYKQSEIDNGISSLKKKYQGTVDEDGRYHEGASTLISVLNLKLRSPRDKAVPKSTKRQANTYGKM